MTENFVLLPPHAVAQEWGRIAPLFAQAEKHGRGEISVNQTLDEVLAYRMCVHVLEEDGEIVFATASRVAVSDQGRFLDVVFAAGRGGVKILSQRFDQYESAARTMGARAVRCFCRPSVARYLRRYLPGSVAKQGEFYTVVEKEVAI